MVHAKREAVFELLLLDEDYIVVHLLDRFPFFGKLLLDVDNHVVTVPFTSVIDILYQGVSYLSDLDTCQNLRNIPLLDPTPSLLKLI